MQAERAWVEPGTASPLESSDFPFPPHPIQLATMQQQAASMSPEMMRAAMQAAQGVKPEDLRRAGEQVASMPPEALAAQASAAASQLPARERMLLSASDTLKRDGNALFGRGSHAQAAEKYERAVANLESVGGAEAAALRLGCRNNLAACRLALRDWAGARAACDAVLAEDAANRKALYRRGQALLSLGMPAQAEADLAAALRLSDAGDRAAIQEKLDAARAAAKERPDELQASEPAVSEPAVSEPAVSEPAAARPANEEQDGAIEDVEVIEEVEVIRPAAPQAAPPVRFDPHDPRSAEAAAEMLEKNPDQVRAAMDALNGMSDAQLAAQMAAAGAPPGMTPEMARAAAGMVQNLSPDQLR